MSPTARVFPPGPPAKPGQNTRIVFCGRDPSSQSTARSSQTTLCSAVSEAYIIARSRRSETASRTFLGNMTHTRKPDCSKRGDQGFRIFLRVGKNHLRMEADDFFHARILWPPDPVDRRFGSPATDSNP